MKYVKKPIIIEAVHFTKEGGFGDDIPIWLHEAMLEGVVREYRTIDGMDFDVRTLEGIMRSNGDSYIIKGAKGELYPCRGDIFEETYSAVDQKEDSKKHYEIPDNKLLKWMNNHNIQTSDSCNGEYCEF